jgi:hypothetical protein
MQDAILRSFLVSACISSAIFAILTMAHWVVPHTFQTPYSVWLWVVLFAVAFVPRLITILVEPLFKGKRRRKT